MPVCHRISKLAVQVLRANLQTFDIPVNRAERVSSRKNNFREGNQGPSNWKIRCVDGRSNSWAFYGRTHILYLLLTVSPSLLVCIKGIFLSFGTISQHEQSFHFPRRSHSLTANQEHSIVKQKEENEYLVYHENSSKVALGK